ncbi:hypothetical protein D3C87_1191330 [compost metagenome]
MVINFSLHEIQAAHVEFCRIDRQTFVLGCPLSAAEGFLPCWCFQNVIHGLRLLQRHGISPVIEGLRSVGALLNIGGTVCNDIASIAKRGVCIGCYALPCACISGAECISSYGLAAPRHSGNGRKVTPEIIAKVGNHTFRPEFSEARAGGGVIETISSKRGG